MAPQPPLNEEALGKLSAEKLANLVIAEAKGDADAQMENFRDNARCRPVARLCRATAGFRGRRGARRGFRFCRRSSPHAAYRAALVKTHGRKTAFRALINAQANEAVARQARPVAAHKAVARQVAFVTPRERRFVQVAENAFDKHERGLVEQRGPTIQFLTLLDRLPNLAEAATGLPD